MEEETLSAETPEEKAQDTVKETVPIKKKRKTQRGEIGWQFFMTVLFIFGMLLLSSGLYVAWTTYHDSDLMEPFVCGYEESDMHARRVSEAFENIASRAEALNSKTFFPGNVNYGYCVSVLKNSSKEEKEEIVYSNLKRNGMIIFDENICSLLDITVNDAAYDLTKESQKNAYYDCYWWDVESDPKIIYKGYSESRVKIPSSILKAKNISKIGICYSKEILDEKEKNWKDYVQFMYIMVIILLLGAIVSLYSGIQLLIHGRLGTGLRKCFLEIPYIMILGSIFALYSCYERKISLFSSQNHMEMLTTSVGTVQLFIDMIAGAFILTSCFLVLFLGLHILVIKSREHSLLSTSVLKFLYKNIQKGLKGDVPSKEFFGKLGYHLRFAVIKLRKAWKLFWGVFTGRTIKGNAIAESERKRTLFSAAAITACTLCAIVTYMNMKIEYHYEMIYFHICCILLLIFIAVYFFGSIYNTVDYAKLEQMMEEVYQGNYQEVQVKKSGILKWSPCFTDAEKLEQIGNGFQRAVEDQIHAERLKIELLTNVSHDLKTPLTSIISYVELLCMEEGLSKEAKDYVLVLKKKAERLKIIISDVFELAKTTSGEIQIEKKEIDFYRLVIQTLGDMQDQIDASDLKIKKKLTQENVMIFSDGERMYRVLQNLLDNALKYSLKGTRIYLDLISEQGQMTFTMKNIAGYEMEFNSEDITERFFRGDKNRTTEGSGLGLSIAQGFTIACGGTFSVVIEGDMFKVVIQFPVIVPEKKKEEEVGK